jgi:hypothetical protein
MNLRGLAQNLLNFGLGRTGASSPLPQQARAVEPVQAPPQQPVGLERFRDGFDAAPSPGASAIRAEAPVVASHRAAHHALGADAFEPAQSAPVNLSGVTPEPVQVSEPAPAGPAAPSSDFVASLDDFVS